MGTKGWAVTNLGIACEMLSSTRAIACMYKTNMTTFIELEDTLYIE
jgi:hypothetical protein